METKKTITPRRRLEHSKRGGRREGAGRKAEGAEPRTTNVVFGTERSIYELCKKLRELTKGDEKDFNRQFDEWVRKMARDYGLE